MDTKVRFKEAEESVLGRRYEEAVQIYKEIMEVTEGQDVYYWALKHLGDVVGYLGYKDYFQSIDIYQKIVMEYEGEEDHLYELSQLDMARAYLELGLSMFESFDSTVSMLEPQDDKMINYKKELLEKRNEYIENEGEILFKERL